MFWKKKTTAEPAENLVDLEDQRASFRYVFRQKDQPAIRFKDRTVRVYDISAGGIAFENRGFSQYDADEVSLDLQMPGFYGDPVLSARVRILHITANEICHSIFENCSVDEYEMIHKYVLEMQKKDLRQRS